MVYIPELIARVRFELAKTMNYILAESLQCYMQNRIISDHFIQLLACFSIYTWEPVYNKRIHQLSKTLKHAVYFEQFFALNNAIHKVAVTLLWVYWTETLWHKCITFRSYDLPWNILETNYAFKCSIVSVCLLAQSLAWTRKGLSEKRWKFPPLTCSHIALYVRSSAIYIWVNQSNGDLA